MNEYEEVAAGDGSVGQRLRQAREARGLTLDDVATQTRIPIRHLRSIEDSNWDELPAVTYTIGFARSYANAVGLDGVEVGRELREQLGGGTGRHQISPDVYAPPDPARVPSRPLAWIAALLAIVLIVGYIWWRSRLDSDDQVAQAPPPAEQQAAQQPLAQPQAPQNLAGQPVTLVATADVWMHVNDGASNRRLYFGTLRSGERFQVPADATRPVMMLTTNPQNLRVMIGGQDRGQLAPERRRLTNQSLKAEDLAGASAQPGQAPAAAPVGGQPLP